MQLCCLLYSSLHHIKYQVGFLKKVIHVHSILIELHKKLILTQFLLLLAEHLIDKRSPNVFRLLLYHGVELPEGQLLTHLLRR
jgi:hypothetical protein